MSDYHVAVVDEHATRDEARLLADNVLRLLIEQRIVEERLDPEAVLGGAGGYRPGKRIPQLYTGSADACFWTLLTNGMEVITRPWFNIWGIPQLQELACPRCAKNFGNDFPDEFGNAITAFQEGNPRPLVSCPNCGEQTAAASWRAYPHLGFCNLTFVFWNWPLLYGEGWDISVPAVIEKTLGHPVVLAYGRV